VNDTRAQLYRVILLPGGVLPAGLAYEALLAELSSSVEARTKDLEVYAADRPSPDYSLSDEVAGIERLADQAGFNQFHLVGYSGGGAAALAFTAKHPNRLHSLALLEPAWAGNAGLSVEERELRQRFRELCAKSPQEFMAGFTRLQLRPGVSPPPPRPEPPPDWMAKRPAGLTALVNAFDAADLDLQALRHFDRPVLFSLGGLSNADYYERMAARLARVFPDFTLEVYPDRHHFDPPHRIEPKRLASELLRLWKRAEPSI
jgi:pimeloyl-ACP methyl ester carboxylesterase